MNKSLYIWHYIVYVPLSAVAAAELVAPSLNNPSGIEETFQPVHDADENIVGYVADFLSTEDGVAPSKTLLEGALSGNPAFAPVLWWRMDNEHIPGSEGPILRAKHESVAGTIGEPWTMAQAVAAVTGEEL
jgi:hypothetical protein